MTVIGLCGGSGSGKGTVSGFFSELGIVAIDTDAVYHQLTERLSPCVKELCSEFGEDILTDGALDRSKLSKRIFSSDDVKLSLDRLNSITHKYILREVREQIDSLALRGDCFVIVDAPLLFESGFDKECDLIIGIVADRSLRIERIMKRDLLSYEDAKKRIDSQISDDVLRQKCDYLICNNGDLARLDADVEEIYKKIIGNGDL